MKTIIPKTTDQLLKALTATESARLAALYSAPFAALVNTTQHNLNYAIKWISMAETPEDKTNRNPVAAAAQAGKSAAPHTPAALENLTGASQDFIEAIQLVPTVQTDLTNKISALLAAARKRPVNTAELIAAAKEVALAAADVPVLTHYLQHCTEALTAAAKDTSGNLTYTPDTASAHTAEAKNIADFMNTCVNTLKKVA